MFLIKLKAICGVLKQLAPYAAIELILPGGTILALLLWLYQRHRAAAARQGRDARGLARDAVFSGQSAVQVHSALQIGHQPYAWAPYPRSSASSSAS